MGPASRALANIPFRQIEPAKTGYPIMLLDLKVDSENKITHQRRWTIRRRRNLCGLAQNAAHNSRLGTCGIHVDWTVESFSKTKAKEPNCSMIPSSG
jgi:hypothetical protein